MTRVRLATRGSDLALAQARGVARRIERLLGVETELVVVKTSGDRLRDVSLARYGGKGLFVKEIEEALQGGRADLAVHSAKDLPAERPAALVLAAVPEREDPRDALVGRERGATLASLPRGARVGTGSVRRAAQLRRARADLEIVPMRGNVPTRLRKLEAQELDAVILACAGLDRLGLAECIDERIAPELLLPAVGQGTIAIEARRGETLAGDTEALSDPDAARSLAAERAFLTRLEGDCNVPLAAYAERTAPGTLRLRALLADVSGRTLLESTQQGSPEGAASLGERAAREVLGAGGEALLARLRAEAEA